MTTKVIDTRLPITDRHRPEALTRAAALEITWIDDSAWAAMVRLQAEGPKPLPAKPLNVEGSR